MADKTLIQSDGTLAAILNTGSITSSLVRPVTTYSTVNSGGTLHPGSYYQYYVTATTASGGESYGTLCMVSPTVPAGTATNKIILNWNCVVGATGYKIYGRQTGVPGPITLTLVSGGSLTASTAYDYQVTATNASGETSGSTRVSTTTDTTNKSIQISWTRVTGATGYKVYGRSHGGTLTLMTTIGSGDTTSWTDDGTVTPGTTGVPYNSAWPYRQLMATISDRNTVTWTDDGSITPSGNYVLTDNFEKITNLLFDPANASTHFGYQAISVGYLSYGTAFGHQARGSAQHTAFGYRSGTGETGVPTGYGSVAALTFGVQIGTSGGLSVGYRAVAGANGHTIGSSSNSYPMGTIVGHNTSNYYGVCIGHSSSVLQYGSIGFGQGITSNSTNMYNNVSLGSYCTPTRFFEITQKLDGGNNKHSWSEFGWYGKTTDGDAHEMGIFGADYNTTPINVSLSTATTGGTLAPGTYYYRLCSNNYHGLSLPTSEYSIVVPAGTNTNTVTVSWSYTGWNGNWLTLGTRIYGRTTGATTLVGETSGVGVTSFTDIGNTPTASTVPTVDGSFPRVVLSNHSAIMFDFECVAFDPTNTCCKGWNIRGVISRGATAGTTQISTLSSNSWSDGGGGTASWNCTLQADTTYGALKPVITGSSGATVNWCAQATVVEAKP